MSSVIRWSISSPKFTRLDVLSADADLSRILGVDVELSNETVTETSTNVPDITNIDLRADAVVTFDGAQLPIGELVTDNLPADVLTEMRGTRLTETDDFDVRLTAVEQDGRWYFSVFHTIAEMARADLDPGTLIPVEGIGATGAESPEAAFDGMLDQVEALDLTGLLRSLNPGEAAALQRYAPLFLDDADAALDEVPLDWKITRREFSVDENGDDATVFLEAIAVEGTVDGGTFSFEFADGCMRASGGDESIEQCTDGAFSDATGMLDDAPDVERLVETVTAAFSDMEKIGLELRRTDGLWYVSPVSTMSEAVLTVLRALDRSELDAIIEQAPAAGEEFFDAFLGGFGDFPGIMEEPAMTDDGSAMEDMTDDQSYGDESYDEAASSTLDDCYAEADADAAMSCFQAGVDAGEFGITSVPVVLRYPECGYTESWSGGIYQLPDDEFIAVAEAARPCFLDLVDAGVISEFELPTEIASLECFEGRNWYNVFDDEEYTQRYFDCLSAG